MGKGTDQKVGGQRCGDLNLALWLCNWFLLIRQRIKSASGLTTRTRIRWHLSSVGVQNNPYRKAKGNQVHCLAADGVDLVVVNEGAVNS